MLLTIDEGNTRCKIGVFEEDRSVETRTFDHLSKEKAQELLEAFPSIEAAILCRTSAPHTSGEEYLRERMDLYELTMETPLPFNMDYGTPETLGKDRIANVAGVIDHYEGNTFLIIDIGTCITYELVHDRTFLGGNISPGPNMRAKAMHNFTHGLPLVNIEEIPNTALGKDTEGALSSGIHYGILYELDGTIEQWNKVYKDMKVVLTGGGHKTFEKGLKSRIFADPHLTLKGLNTILQYEHSS